MSRRLRIGCAALAGLCLVGSLMLERSSQRPPPPLPPPNSTEQELAARLREHVEMLAGSIGERNLWHYPQLQQTTEYIAQHLRALGYQVRQEPYQADGKPIMNLEAELKGHQRPEEVVVCGAHYDTVPGSPGANDNASGVAALLELARHFHDQRPGRTLRFVAFVNEELPWFRTPAMGSWVYAAGARRRNERIVAMLSLETIGYYSDIPGSQLYPFPIGWLYPDTGNFIGFVGNLRSRSLVRQASYIFRQSSPLPAESLAAPEFIQGVGWSDQWAFWQEGYPGIMITDTAPYRYPHYHRPSDTPDKLDYQRMALVVSGLETVLERLSR